MSEQKVSSVAPSDIARRQSVFVRNTESVDVLGRPPARADDLYHLLLRLSWIGTLGGIAAVFVFLNVVFALFYTLSGGVVNVREGSFLDAFFFSVQTIGTIGYGVMYPSSVLAHSIVSFETLTGIIFIAIITGLLFAKFSRLKARVRFTREAIITPMNGVPTLTFRVSNERGNYVVEAQVRVAILRRERTEEGVWMYRMRELKLERDRSPAFTRTWTIMHTIDAESPLYNETPESLAECKAEIVVTLIGIDENASQTIHARNSYIDDDIRWGARHADILTDLGNGRYRMDLKKFDDLVPTKATPTFPYPPG